MVTFVKSLAELNTALNVEVRVERGRLPRGGRGAPARAARRARRRPVRRSARAGPRGGSAPPPRPRPSPPARRRPPQERNLLSVAYKNVVGARRASWRVLSSIEAKEKDKADGSKVAAIGAYRDKVRRARASESERERGGAPAAGRAGRAGRARGAARPAGTTRARR